MTARPWTPDERDPETGVTTIRVKRACNGCGTQLGDVTQEELSAVMSERPLPDVREECPKCRAARPEAIVPDALFRLLLDVTMQADPHPWSAEEDEQLKHYLDAESRARGYDEWVVAYHEWTPQS